MCVEWTQRWNTIPHPLSSSSPEPECYGGTPSRTKPKPIQLSCRCCCCCCYCCCVVIVVVVVVVVVVCVQAAKSDPMNPDIFLYLGHYQKQITGDLKYALNTVIFLTTMLQYVHSGEQRNATRKPFPSSPLTQRLPSAWETFCGPVEMRHDCIVMSNL